MDRDSLQEAIRDFISQIYNTGVTFSIEWVGSVLVERSLYSEETLDQKRIGEKLIKSVADKVHQANDEKVSNVDDVHGELTLIQSEIDLNVTYKSVLFIDCNDYKPKIFRLEIKDISLIVPGENELNKYFCLFAKCVNDDIKQRKCFVFHTEEEKSTICQVLKLAFSIAERMSRSSSEKSKSSSGFDRERSSSGYSTASSTNSRQIEEEPRQDDIENGRVKSVSDLIHFYQTKVTDPLP